MKEYQTMLRLWKIKKRKSLRHLLADTLQESQLVKATRQMKIPASMSYTAYKKWPEWSKQIKASRRSQVEPKLWNVCGICRIITLLYTLYADLKMAY